MKIELLVGMGGFMLAMITSLAGVMLWFANSEKKKYGLERDFNHIKNHQEQTNIALNHLLTEMDKRFDLMDRDILEIKVQLGLKRHRGEIHLS